jgi:hypothetical protein
VPEPTPDGVQRPSGFELSRAGFDSAFGPRNLQPRIRRRRVQPAFRRKRDHAEAHVLDFLMNVESRVAIATSPVFSRPSTSQNGMAVAA